MLRKPNNHLHLRPFISTIGFHQHRNRATGIPQPRLERANMNLPTRKTRLLTFVRNIKALPKNEKLPGRISQRHHQRPTPPKLRPPSPTHHQDPRQADAVVTLGNGAMPPLAQCKSRPQSATDKRREQIAGAKVYQRPKVEVNGIIRRSLKHAKLNIIRPVRK